MKTLVYAFCFTVVLASTTVAQLPGLPGNRWGQPAPTPAPVTGQFTSSLFLREEGGNVFSDRLVGEAGWTYQVEGSSPDIVGTGTYNVQFPAGNWIKNSDKNAVVEFKGNSTSRFLATLPAMPGESISFQLRSNSAVATTGTIVIRWVPSDGTMPSEMVINLGGVNTPEAVVTKDAPSFQLGAIGFDRHWTTSDGRILYGPTMMWGGPAWETPKHVVSLLPAHKGQAGRWELDYRHAAGSQYYGYDVDHQLFIGPVVHTHPR